jgi:sensor domain CHASE-containing protein
MFSPFIIPLAVFAMVAVIVGITHMAKLRDKEMQIQQQLHAAQLEHQRKMLELQTELERVKQG